MTTGRVEYSPDYKSEKVLSGKRLIDAAQKIWNDSEAAKERDRLERAVLETAKAFRLAERAFKLNSDDDVCRAYIEAQERAIKAVDDLLTFEELNAKAC